MSTRDVHKRKVRIDAGKADSRAEGDRPHVVAAVAAEGPALNRLEFSACDIMPAR